MKKIILVLLLATVCLSLFALSSCGFNAEAKEMIGYCDRSIEPISANDGCYVEIDADAYSMAIYRIPGDQITVQYVENANSKLTYSMDALGNVKIQQKLTTLVHATNLYIVIGIPSSWSNYHLDVDLDAGSVSIEDLVLNTLHVELDAGTANIDVEKANVVDVDVNAGTVNLEGTATTVDVESDAGSILVDMSATYVDISTDTGTINFELEDCLRIEVEADTGTINGKIEGAKNSYTIKTDVSLGKCNLKNQTGDGVHSLEISLDTGKANIRFDD